MPTSPRRPAGKLLALVIVVASVLLTLSAPASEAGPSHRRSSAPPAPIPDYNLPADKAPSLRSKYEVLSALVRPSVAQPVVQGAPTLTLDDTENILVLGIDYRAGGKMWRTDTIMIVAVDQIERKVGIISIPRDLWVDIPGYGEGRINIADFYGEQTGYPGGGPALVGKIVGDHFKISVHHWVRVQQEALVRLVDRLGGVQVTLDCPLLEKTPHPDIRGEYEYLRLPAGENWLDGETAKKFATFRYATTDFNRSRRQQQLIWAIRQRVEQIDVMLLVPELWNDLYDMFQTDLTLLDMFRYAALGTQLQPEDVRGLTLPRTTLAGKLVQGNQVLVVSDPAALQEALDNLFAARPLADLGRSVTGQCR